MNISNIINPGDVGSPAAHSQRRHNSDTFSPHYADASAILSAMTSPTRNLRPRSQPSPTPTPTPSIPNPKPKRTRPTPKVDVSTSNHPKHNYAPKKIAMKHKQFKRNRSTTSQSYVRSTLSQSTLASSASTHSTSTKHRKRHAHRPLFSQARFLLSKARETLSVSMSESKDWLVRGGPSIMDIILDPAYTAFVNTSASELNSSGNSDDGSSYSVSDPLERSRFLCPLHRAYSFTVLDPDSLDLYWSKQELLYVGVPVTTGAPIAQFPESIERTTSREV